MFAAFVPTQMVAAYFVKTFAEFPRRQKSASFNIDQILKRLEEGTGAGK